jgi:hypothetical protein
MNPDPDPGGPKTYGSDGSGFGYATLLKSLNNLSITEDQILLFLRDLQRLQVYMKNYS